MPKATMIPTTFPVDALEETKIKFPPSSDTTMDLTYSWFLYSVGQRIQPWGTGTAMRDAQLRDFWPTEPFLAGAFYSAAIRDANYEWEIEGPNEHTVNALTDMIHGAIAGQTYGWMPFVTLWTQDWRTQDNGAFIELIRDPAIDVTSRFKDEVAPVIGLAHLDAGKCVRTGNPMKPVIYEDRDGKYHPLKWFQVVALSEFPSPVQKMNGVGYSAVSRILKFAEIIQSIEIYTDEKVSGRHIKEIHFVGGVSKMEIEDIRKRHEEEADNKGLSRFIQPLIYASLDPEKPVTTASIDLASLPDNFDFDTLMRWYIANVALNTGGDYQDLAPLPSGNIGSSAQSEILHRKSRGKGPANFMETIQNITKNYGIIPPPYRFKFNVKDTAEDMELAEMKTKMAEFLAIIRRADIVNGETVRAVLRRMDIIEEDDLALTPDDFGNEPTLAKTDNLVGQVGDSTIGEDAQRVKKEKNVLQRMFGKNG